VLAVAAVVLVERRLGRMVAVAAAVLVERRLGRVWRQERAVHSPSSHLVLAEMI